MKFIIATKNKKKLAELERILAPLGIEAISENELDFLLPEVEETGTTFEENAMLKAMSAMNTTGLPAIADDSGLCVEALGGAPGVYSARYAGENARDGDNNEKLLFEMKDIAQGERQAKFVCAICGVFPTGEMITARGECFGEIAFSQMGQGGFGYDPLFLVDGLCFGELSPEKKDGISHRGQALRVLAEKLSAFLKGIENLC